MRSKRVTLSALVQSATLPAPVKVRSVAVNNGLPSNVMREALALRAEPELMPFVRRDFDVRAFELLARAFDHAVEADVVLQRIGAHDIVVVGIGEPHGDAAGLVDLAGDRLEADA